MTQYDTIRAVYHTRARAFEDAAELLRGDVGIGRDPLQTVATFEQLAAMFRNDADSTESSLLSVTLDRVFETWTAKA